MSLIRTISGLIALCVILAANLAVCAVSLAVFALRGGRSRDASGAAADPAGHKLLLVAPFPPGKESGGSKAVLEVRSHETPFLLEDGQTVARLVYEPLTARPERIYGQGGSHYQRQGLKLSKHFKPW